MAALAQLTISPMSQTVAIPSDAAEYMLMLTNPTGTSQTFVPLPPGGSVNSTWGVSLPSSITVPANSTQTFILQLTTPFNLTNGTYPFTLNVTTAGGLTFSTSASLIVGAPGTPGPPTAPAPPSLILICTGLVLAGLYAVRARLRDRFGRS